MFNFITFRCDNCSSVIFNLPNFEIEKLEGRRFTCGCCDHQSVVSGGNTEGSEKATQAMA